MFKIITPVFNSEQWVGKCIQSMQWQSFGEFECIIIDDASTDGTRAAIDKNVGKDSRFKVVSNDRNYGALRNIVEAVKLSGDDPQDIVVTVDGDDWLYDNDVLCHVNSLYSSDQVWLSYGQCLAHGNTYPGGPYDRAICDEKRYREVEWKGTHLRTFRRFLWNNIRSDDLTDPGTEYFWRTAWDMAFMFPMLEMCSYNNLRWGGRVLYQYNTDNPINDYKVRTLEQRQADSRIRGMKRYENLYAV